MKKKIWVLYKSEYYFIVKDTRTSIRELERLPHYYGSYSSYKEASLNGIKKLDMLKFLADENIRYLKEKP